MVRWLVPIILGIAVCFAWHVIWFHSLHVFGIAAFSRRAEDSARRRERIKQMGKVRYVLVFGVLGFGLAFGLGITAADLLEQRSRGWVYAVAKFVLITALAGWLHGARTWNDAFRDPVPFPPNFPAPK